MRAPCLFGIITTAASRRYTSPALLSLVRNTQLTADDEIVIIVNDGDFTGPPTIPAKIIRNETPLSFAQNANQILRLSKGRNALVLNNDLVFTPDWLTPLLECGGISSPFSNNQIAYETPRLKLKTSMELAEIEGQTIELDLIAREHAKRQLKPLELMILPFFCISISPSAYNQIGEFDEAFAPAGGEDFDYCLRAQLAGIKVQYAPRSFVLHFGGGSTWAGPEAESVYRARADKFIHVFEQKWGPALTELVFRPTMAPFAKHPELQRYADTKNFGEIIRALKAG